MPRAKSFARRLASRFSETTCTAAIRPAEVVRAIAPCGRCKIVIADEGTRNALLYLREMRRSVH